MTSRLPEAMPEEKLPSVSLLAIDDEPEFLNIITEALAQESLEIHTSTDAARGLELVRQKHPQIVLVDLRMPGMGGMELLERILGTDPSTDVIMITGDYSTESAVEAIQKGASDYLNKPVSLDQLRQRVGRLIEARRQQQRGSQLKHELLKTVQFEGMV